MEQKMESLFTLSLTQWLRLCPDGIHYRPIDEGDLRIGRKILKVEISLGTSISGSMPNHLTTLTIIKVGEYAGEITCKSNEGDEVFSIHQMLTHKISFHECQMKTSQWRTGIRGVALLMEKE